MKPKTRRLALVLFALAGLGGATALALSALQDSIVFFYSPSDIAKKNLPAGRIMRSEEHTSELQSHSFISYAVFCLKKKNKAQ